LHPAHPALLYVSIPFLYLHHSSFWLFLVKNHDRFPAPSSDDAELDN
jgi:hypothetical protein